MGNGASVGEKARPPYLRRETEYRDRTDAVAYGTGARDYSLWVELSFACKNLVNKDILSLSDPFVVLYADEKDGLQEVGRTEVISNDLNPKFVRSFQVLYEFEKVQRFKVEVYDADDDQEAAELKLEDQDFLGYAEFCMTDIITGADIKTELKLLNTSGKPMKDSTIVIYYEEQNDQSDEVKVVLGARLEKPRSSGLFYRISKKHDHDETWMPVYRSEVVAGTENVPPYLWNPLETRLRGLCNASVTRPLLIEVLYFKKNGQHQLVGTLTVTAEELSADVPGTAISLECCDAWKSLARLDLTSAKGNEVTGKLYVQEFVRTASSSFLEYIASGYEICFLVAIDFTRSNGLPEYLGSLHHIRPDETENARKLNVYEEAIYGVGRVLESYDSDHLFPTWGFGAKLPGESNIVSHCFAINGDDAAPECRGVDGILQAYREALNRVTLAGPTLLGPVLKAACTMAARENYNKYYCLLIITDGVLVDMPRVKREIIAASSLPLSIMLVGVGEEEFDKMVELDSDDRLLSEDGVFAERDIVQFVEFDKHKTDGEGLANELLAEFPGQFLSYMKKHGIQPLKPENRSQRMTSETPSTSSSSKAMQNPANEEQTGPSAEATAED